MKELVEWTGSKRQQNDCKCQIILLLWTSGLNSKGANWPNAKPKLSSITWVVSHSIIFIECSWWTLREKILTVYQITVLKCEHMLWRIIVWISWLAELCANQLVVRNQFRVHARILLSNWLPASKEPSDWLRKKIVKTPKICYYDIY